MKVKRAPFSNLGSAVRVEQFRIDWSCLEATVATRLNEIGDCRHQGCFYLNPRFTVWGLSRPKSSSSRHAGHNERGAERWDKSWEVATVAEQPREQTRLSVRSFLQDFC